ncbi:MULTISPECIES: trigger factor [Olivibacter]|uniref:Trigger factor n=2 Tax=Olivibacter TaxID=376469 RepID=A0ABV6HIN5_9SPHI|nr:MULTISPECIES: trigger factor [Olivibacter]MCL4639175.1 trigger factor [Olivibacter sp. UJ_SKK_5.1]MDM8174713.1 trigger factor [Olivibacter sp. 47]MDX3913533.1 trigger factor [Pseudosphingobacterium sp.]QEL01504.1 trigger factor [Olivibacter sp. LS-1]
MNISQERVDDLNAVINVEITPADYTDRVNKAIKEQAKKAKLPGFRPGMVPASHIKKTYGKAILFDEINRLVSDSLNNYLTENKVEVLGQPLPKEGSESSYNWDFNDEFKFQYEIGLAPAFEVPFSEKDKVTQYDIKVDDETLASRIKNLRKSYGKMTNPEVSEDGDVLYSTLTQLDASGNALEGGISNTASVRTDLVDDKKIKKSLIGLKKDDEVKIDLKKAFKDDTIARILNITEEEAAALTEGTFKLVVKNVNRLEEADLNQELFDKLFGKDEVKTEEEFKARVTSEVESMLVQNSDQRLQQDLYNLGMEKVNVQFPDEFLRKWLKATNEKLTDEELSEGYDDFVKNLKWTLIENKIITENKLEIKYEEVFKLAKERIAAQFKMYSPEPISEEQLAQYTVQFLQDKEQANRLFEEVKALKVFDFLKGVVKLNKKEIDYNKFLELK